MGLSRRKFTKEVKVAAIRRLDAGASVAEVARAFEVNPNVLHRWRKEFRHGPGNAFPGAGKRRWDETKVAQLERKGGQQALGVDFLRGCFTRIKSKGTGYSCFRAWCAVRFQRLHGVSEGSRRPDQHEPERKSLRQREMRIIYE